MASTKGTLVLMGSGELTATMVEVHKAQLAARKPSPNAVFLDTPAGFQLNVDQISRNAVAYFRRHVGHPLQVASFHSRRTDSDYQAERAFRTLREADYVLIGPGSPTYAVRQLAGSPVPDIFENIVLHGSCLVFASAAALTAGAFTLPVYEIYKVGEEPHWKPGLDILGRLGFHAVVIPHWNNAEGGTHDTRYCFMGAPRFAHLQSLLPEDVSVIGLDEHTACIIEFARSEFEIRGLGRMTLRIAGSERHFEKGRRYPLADLQEAAAGGGHSPAMPAPAPAEPAEAQAETEDSYWERVHALQATFQRGLENRDPDDVTNALLELDRTLWQAQENLEGEEFISQGREILRDLIVTLGTAFEGSPADRRDCLAPVLDALLDARETLRAERQWPAADAIRDAMQQAGVVVEDTEDGARWRLEDDAG